MRAARVGVLFVGGLIAVAAVVVAVLLGTGGGGDEEAIEDVINELFAGFEEQNAEKLAGVFAAECGDMFDDAIAALQEFQSAGDEIGFEIAGVDVRNQEEDTAEALPQGFIIIDEQRSPLTEEGEDYTPLVKEDGDWKIAACDLFE
ncbi:MAG: hypothetical protein IH959_09870 [Chloroflexi bacterium]|nr:hypothetical protein [Chloroflexota bacterium]